MLNVTPCLSISNLQVVLTVTFIFVWLGPQASVPPPAPTRQASSRIAAANAKAAVVPSELTLPSDQTMYTAKATVISQSPSRKDISLEKKIELASTAAALRANVLSLRTQVDELRLLQHDNVTNFKSFMHKCSQEFNLLADRVNNNGGKLLVVIRKFHFDFSRTLFCRVKTVEMFVLLHLYEQKSPDPQLKLPNK